jgi:hypothetical protein
MRDAVPALRASPATWLVAALVSAAAIFPFHPLFRKARTVYVFEAMVSSSARGNVQLFYDLGRGFNEQDSGRVLIRGGVGPKPFQFGLPYGHYSELRFDPLDHPGVITVSGALIRDGIGRVIMRFPPSAFTATKQIGRMAVAGDTLTIETTPGANDPNTLIGLERPFDLLPPPPREWIESLEWFAGVFAALTAVIALGPRMLGAGTRALRRMAIRPKAALAAAALASVVLSSYPVILCGRSFVSPNCGVLLLYEGIPTLPGYDSTVVKDGHGSDVGAAMWWHVPISRVQNEALFHDHELPLWNRYNLCGQSLLGQGQSMIGDPLHLATAVLFGGRAWAWDLKYLAAKWLFAFGVGLVVLAATRRLGIAALLCASSVYMGFFSFYLNHPTFFSLCYSPWILLAWVRIAGTADRRSVVAWCGALLAADWFELNSGTVKEAYVLTLCLNLAGLLALLANRDERALRRWKVAATLWANLLFGLLSAPIWLPFLDTLRGSFTSYMVPQARQVPSMQLIGFFEDLFYRQNTAGEIHVAPSTNFLVLLGVLWALAHARRLAGDRMLLALGAAAVVPFMLVFGIIPKAAITAVPFLGNILHIDSTFSCVLIVLSLPVAGIGLASFVDGLADDGWHRHLALVLCMLGALLGLYFGLDRHLAPSSFFSGYVPSLLMALVVLQLAARHLATRDTNRVGAILLVALALAALHWRQGQYVATAFDAYVSSPQVRGDFRARSPAIQSLAAPGSPPTRTVGLGLNLFPGFNSMYLIEGIYGIDALRSREYEDLAMALGLGRVLASTTYQGDEGSPDFRAAFDALNVGDFLGSSPPTPGAYSGWKRVQDLDLTVYRSPTAWPRAYFVDTLARYVDLGELVSRVQAAKGVPFAAVQEKDVHDLPELETLPENRPGRTVVPATDYALTNNTTSFDITASGPGAVVLTETWLKGDFEATVNGRPVPYFRVNHAFKGIFVNAPGNYRIKFSYWPRHLTLALWMSALGATLGFGSYVCWHRRGGPPGRYPTHHVEPQGDPEFAG